MSFSRLLAAGLFVSVLVHASGSAYFAEDGREVSTAASQGGAVSVIGSLEDLVAGAQADAVEIAEPVEELEPVREPVDPVEPPTDVREVKPVETVQPVQVAQAENVKAIQPVVTPVTAASVPIVKGVTTTEAVTANEAPKEIKPDPAKLAQAAEKPVKAVSEQKTVAPLAPAETAPASLPQETLEAKTTDQPPVEQKPIELAKPVEIEETKPQEVKPVQPVQQAELSEPIEDPLATVTQAPRLKPEPPVRKVAKKQPTKQKKPAQSAQRKGAEASSRKGGETVTAKAATSNANGKAKAKGNDGGQKARSNYEGKVRAKLRRAQRYPKKASRKKITGTVRVSFTVSKSGSVSGIRLLGSSGHAILDQAAIDMVRRASPMPKFPKGIGRNSWKFDIPVSFSARR